MRAALRTSQRLVAAVVAGAALAGASLPSVAAPLGGDPADRVVRTGSTSPAPSPSTSAPSPSPRGELSVTVDRAKVVRLPERVQTVVLGNPSIADVAIQKSGVVVLTGKSYGVTNLIALDAGGNMLAESIVSVSAPTDTVVTVQRGLDRQSLSCTPSCQPSVVLGDSLPYFSDVRSQADQHRQFSTQR